PPSGEAIPASGAPASPASVDSDEPASGLSSCGPPASEDWLTPPSTPASEIIPLASISGPLLGGTQPGVSSSRTDTRRHRSRVKSLHFSWPSSNSSQASRDSSEN